MGVQIFETIGYKNASPWNQRADYWP